MRILTFISFILLSNAIFAQTSNDNKLKAKALSEKKAEFNKRNKGEVDGFRIKLHFGSDRAKAMEVKSRFLSKYGDVGAYDQYQQPNFVIVVGDFKTKIEAFEFYKKIQVDFPNAFIVKDRVKTGRN